MVLRTTIIVLCYDQRDHLLHLVVNDASVDLFPSSFHRLRLYRLLDYLMGVDLLLTGILLRRLKLLLLLVLYQIIFGFDFAELDVWELFLHEVSERGIAHEFNSGFEELSVFFIGVVEVFPRYVPRELYGGFGVS